MTLDELLQRLDIGEDQDTEFKAAADGKLPKSIWETISAFANTEGGYIILGVEQRNNKFQVVGIKNPDSLRKNFWDTYNNTSKLSMPLCVESNVRLITIDERQLLILHIPRAQRNQRPVYINNNPMIGTYKRNYEGDYHCSKDEVQQMLRDASDKPQDIKILHNFDLGDLDANTLKAFRQRFISREPDHPFLALDDKRLLHQLGGWHHDRETGEEGLTLAGLLMFGRERSISDALPYYQLDYRELFSSDPEQRWTYRLTIDGKWEPNLFNFYYSVYGRLVKDLDIPFQLDEEAVRRDETHVHQALREGLVNTLVHADHQSVRPILITKRADRFLFSNPGRLRIPLQRLYEGGMSDPRNPNLQKMFQMIGLGEKAGSGFQKILRAWQEQSWAVPLVSEKLDVEVTSILLPMISMIPEAVAKELKEIVGDAYSLLSEIDRIALVLAHRLNEISNGDVKQHRPEHPQEIGGRLTYLVERGWLKRQGRGRGTRYSLCKVRQGDSNIAEMNESSGHYSPSSGHNDASSGHYSSSSGLYEAENYSLDTKHYADLMALAKPIREKRRANRDQVISIILKLCSEHYLSIKQLSEFLERNSESLRKHYINTLIKEGFLQLRYPRIINHPQQRYKTILKSDN